MNAKREYKDSVFTMLFNNKQTLIELYNALTGSKFPPDTPVEITTLTNVLFNSWRDDIAFVIDGKLIVLVEDQSTINENMPLRFFIYLARVYEKLIDSKALYKSKLLKIPKPEFIVLYNGIEPFPEEKTLKLSDAYMEMPEAAGLGGSMELTVRVLNINEGHNVNIVKQCPALAGYVSLITKVRKRRAEGSTLNEAVTNAVRECVSEGILNEFLKAHAYEVMNFMTLIYDEAEARKYAREEGREDGLEEGMVKGMEKGRVEGRVEGLNIAALIFRALKNNEPVEDIAARYQQPVSKIIDYQTILEA